MTESRKNRLIEIARAMSDKRTGRSFHVSFILDKNQILSIGWNDYLKSHSRARFGEYKSTRRNRVEYMPARHSECSSITKLLNTSGSVPNFKRLTLFNVRIGFNGETMLAKPCDNCAAWIKEFGIGEVIWT